MCVAPINTIYLSLLMYYLYCTGCMFLGAETILDISFKCLFAYYGNFYE